MICQQSNNISETKLVIVIYVFYFVYLLRLSKDTAERVFCEVHTFWKRANRQVLCSHLRPFLCQKERTAIVHSQSKIVNLKRDTLFFINLDAL